jgi:hypothetical protein
MGDGVESRFKALHETSPTPLLGREAELELLLRRWTAGDEFGQVDVIAEELQ